ncbi:hypothetical protein [Flavobacterium panici]|uniref:Uncharacterized protein n=1 Tax=Flavobacterium panici TaxID=2654843 RepID=A0A9N8P4F2_9FLAO|nr:hypothetical protein [Flavobacterium panici]CAC9977087.1 hypothetical protein FLAPXU55_04819 [Flavobacterium panici]
MKAYTKANLEQIVMMQLENLNAINDLLSIMKLQNELIHNANKKLKDEISEFKEKSFTYSANKIIPNKTKK